jgi:hypothetical protein
MSRLQRIVRDQRPRPVPETKKADVLARSIGRLSRPVTCFGSWLSAVLADG